MNGLAIISATIDPIVGVVAALILGPLGAYLVAARRFSGKIGSSDASQLWEESRAIRDWSRERIAVLDSTVTSLGERVGQLEHQNLELVRENDRLVLEIRELSDTIVDLRQEVINLTGELRLSRARVAQLEDTTDDSTKPAT